MKASKAHSERQSQDATEVSARGAPGGGSPPRCSPVQGTGALGQPAFGVASSQERTSTPIGEIQTGRRGAELAHAIQFLPWPLKPVSKELVTLVQPHSGEMRLTALPMALIKQ